MTETVTIPKQEYDMLKRQAKVDMNLLQQFMSSLADIKSNRVKRVR